MKIATLDDWHRELLARLMEDQRARWRGGVPRLLEEYLAEHPAVAANSEAVLALLYNEIVLRKQRGESPSPLDYSQRFPHLADEIAYQFAADALLDTLDQSADDSRAPQAESSAAAPLSDGQVLPAVPGYRIKRKLGQGGMGVVYLAEQLHPRRTVALKMVLGGIVAGPDRLIRFLAETEVIAQLDHPNIVRLFECGCFNDLPYYTLEFIPGGSLEAQLQGRPLPVRDAVHLIEQLARGVAHAHERGVIHRDLKPANVLLQIERGRADSSQSAICNLQSAIPKITDFGLALRQGGAGMTGTGAVMGTLQYMAPEQITGKTRDIGVAADIYALGCIFYECLTGRTPFVGTSLAELAPRVVSEEPVAPRRLASGIPLDVETICLKCLEKEPAKRYRSGVELTEDLRRWLEHRPIQARPVGSTTRLWKWARRNPIKVVLLAALLLVLLGLGLLLRSEGQRRDGLRQEDAADFATVLAQVEGDRFHEAEGMLPRAFDRVHTESMLADAAARWQELAGVIHFFVRAEEAHFRAGEERYEEGKEASEAALQHLDILDDEGEFRTDWWDRLPAERYSDELVLRIRTEVYRQLLLLTYLRAVQWLGDIRNPAAPVAFHRAWDVLLQAHDYEKGAGIPPAQSVNVLARMLRNLCELTGQPLHPWTAQQETRFSLVPETLPANDYFFKGAIHYYVAPLLNDFKGRMGVNLLLKGVQDMDLKDPWQTAEDQLREAIRLEPQQYWPNFVLGRVLLERQKTSEALMAFNACVAVQKDYPVSYQFRALALSKLAMALPKEDKRREQLVQRAMADSATALRLANEQRNPAIYWSRGEMYAVLGQEKDALEAYARGLEQEQELGKKVSRSKVLVQVEKMVNDILRVNPRNADAHAVLALVHLTRGKNDDARKSAAAALAIDDKHERANAVMKRISGK